MFNYEIGGNERRVDTSEAFGDIAHNKTLFIQKLTDAEQLKPEKVEGLKTVQDVFNHYKPAVTAAFEKYDGSPLTEAIQFNTLADFSVKNIVAKSPYLSNVNFDKEMSLSVIKQLKTNKALKSTLDNADTKDAFVNTLRAFLAELEEAK
ncbi:hypothetical protein OQY15_03120 [Pedobacter sp. MC2016-15]|uniref:hypothetical protein n=1 Tax=Pedobacter sp. MC2016-15 TaxID=2994473 RepID=UPI002247495D|nr:hypothetical protein [Pedobacter sp. MC2016-15]MCX2478065.1 hypothetical protein [Pedobacter sp. MC2016-15]